jgi:hypothetical protein
MRADTVRNIFKPAEATGVDRARPGVQFDDIRPKTAGSPARLSADFTSRPRTASIQQRGGNRRDSKIPSQSVQFDHTS